MDTAGIPIIEAKKPGAIKVETPVVFNATLVFVNGRNESITMGFACPPGLYPNPKYIVKLVEEAQREGLKALKLKSQDLSWRLPTPTEFVRITSNNPHLHAEPKYAEAYSAYLENEDDNNSN